MPQDQDDIKGADAMKQAPTPGPLSGDDVKLLVKGDWISHHEHGTAQYCPSAAGDRCLTGPWSFVGRPDADGWIDHKASDAPPPDYLMVEYVTGSGLTSARMRVIELRWDRDFKWRPFRLAPTAPVEASGSEREAGWLARAMRPLLPLWGAEGYELPAPCVRGVPDEYHADPRFSARTYEDHYGNLTFALMVGNDHSRGGVWQMMDFTPDQAVQAVAAILSRPGMEAAAAPLLAALRPQPSGETRDSENDPVRRVLERICETQTRLYGNATALHLAMLDLCVTARAELAISRTHPAPVASGGQHSSGEVAGCAESEVGRAVYERIEKLLKTDPTGWERAYLCHLVESVEEVGGYDGPRLDGFPYRKAVAAFLKLRDESVGPGEADDEERLESADIILSLTTPVAETAGEAVAWDHAVRLKDSVHWRLASELSADMAKAIISGDPVFDHFECIPLYTAPVSAQDDDKLRGPIAHEIKQWAETRWPKHARVGSVMWVAGLTNRILAALKSTAAQEGEE